MMIKSARTTPSLRTTCLCLFAAVFAARSNAAPPAIKPMITMPASYVDLYRQILKTEAPRPKMRMGDRAMLADVAFHLWQRTHEPAYRDQAAQLFEQTLADPTFSLADFHVLHHFGELAWRMKQENLFPEQYKKGFETLAVKQLQAMIRSKDNGDYNIRVGTIEGCVGLLKYFEGEPLPQREAAQKWIDNYWDLIVKTGDLDEDASNYDSLGAAFMVDLARLLGRESDLKSAGFRRMFERFRDIVSPTGQIAEYGDAYFHPDTVPMDRVYLMEYAAKVYDDPTFLYAARKMYDRPCTSLPQDDYWARSMALINLELSSASPVTPGGPPSMATYRVRRDTPGLLADKLILRTGLESGSAMILMDLYASGSHSHPQKGPSICYYEAAGVPLFHNMGRHHTRSAIDGSLFWAMPGDERFPGCWDQENEWYTMRIPVDYLTKKGDGLVIPPVMTLRNFQEFSKQCKELTFDNLRLEGSAGVKLVDDFDSSAGWDPRLSKITQITTSTDKTQGAGSQQIAWASLTSDAYNRKLSSGGISQPFTTKEYDWLKLDLKYAGMRPYSHIRSIGEQMDIGDQMLESIVDHVKAEQHGADAFGQINYKTYICADSKLTRQIVLTHEGYLVIHDVLLPGNSMANWNAGQLWQLYQQASSGKDWFASEDDGSYPAAVGGKNFSPRRMVVRFSTASGETAGSEKVVQAYYAPNPKGRKAEQFFTTYSRRALHAGEPAAFTTVVLPQDPSDGDAASLAEKIGVSPAADGVITVSCPAESGGRPVTVTLGNTDWHVTRGN